MARKGERTLDDAWDNLRRTIQRWSGNKDSGTLGIEIEDALSELEKAGRSEGFAPMSVPHVKAVARLIESLLEERIWKIQGFMDKEMENVSTKLDYLRLRTGIVCELIPRRLP